MSDAMVAASNVGADTVAGPLEAQYLGSRLYRNVTDTSRITSTHWHIAWANGLGWGFDGMDGAILALVAPMLMQEFVINLGTYRSGVQIASLIRACRQLSQTTLATSWTAARKLRAVFS